ncbi:MAG: hypothetical protein SF029_12780, partial [bacterium]|nr:hypothetical protein [bacterium]
MNEATAKAFTQQDFGPLDALLKDPDVMEIMVNSYQQIFIEKRGQLIEVQDSFRDEDHLLEIIQNIARP